jgi:uncharacterized protein (TIGR02145 family)
MRRLLLLLASSFMASQAGILSGTVTDLSGTPIAGMTIRLVSSGDSLVTEASGTWSLARTVGVQARTVRAVFGTTHLVQEGNRLGLDWNGHDLLGRGARPTEVSMLRVPARAIAARAQSATDTVIVSWKGKRLSRVPVTALDSTGIVQRLDTAWQDDHGTPWNSGICYGSLRDERDGHVYRTVLPFAGASCPDFSKWPDHGYMAENLAYAAPGSNCPADNEDSCAKYGRHYDWNLAMGMTKPEISSPTIPKGHLQGICPDGWHIPYVESLDTLFSDGSVAPLGWNGPVADSAADRHGARVLPAGYESTGGNYVISQGTDAYFWSLSLDNGPFYPFYIRMNKGTRNTFDSHASTTKYEKYSIRCRHSFRDTLIDSVLLTTGWAFHKTNDSLQDLHLSFSGYGYSSYDLTYSAKPNNGNAVVTLSGVKGPWTTKISKDTAMELVVTLGKGSRKTGLRISVQDTSAKYWNPGLTFGSLTDERDGQEYRTVTVGSQTWMAENLRYKSTGTGFGYAMCPVVNDAICRKYGLLYEWTLARQVDTAYKTKELSSEPAVVQGICPKGWHLPTVAEMDLFLNNAKRQMGTDSGDLAMALLQRTGYSDMRNREDRLGFGLPLAGYGRTYSQNSNNNWKVGTETHLWLRDEHGSVWGNTLEIVSDGFTARQQLNSDGDKMFMLSVRCLAD